MHLYSIPPSNKWDKVFKNGPSKICGRQPLVCLSRPYPFKIFKGCLPQILLGPLLNILTQISSTGFYHYPPPDRGKSLFAPLHQFFWKVYSLNRKGEETM